MFTPVQQVIHITGTLSANVAYRFTAHADMTLKHISAVQSNAGDATLKIGTSADDDLYMTATAVGQSGTPAEFDRDDFVDDEVKQIRKGTIVVLTVDHDGDGGTAAADLTLVATFTPG